MGRKKLLIIGIDGVPIEMINRFAGDGTMPAMKSLLSRGKLVRMSVSIPEISSVSWSSFMTGTDAGNHGIFGFVDLVPGKYDFRFPDFRDLKRPAFFDELGLKGLRSVIVNLPSTYPARPIPGVLISGFVAIDLKKSVFPESYYPILQKFGYQVDVDAAKARDKKAEFLADLHYCLKIKKEMADLLWKNENWDIFMFTITESDRIHHFLFDAYENVDHPFHQEFRHLYQDIDRIIGDFVQRAEEKGDTEIMLLSDHGFGPVNREIYLNPILKKNRFFETETEGVKSLEPISSKAKAFAIDPSRIFIHRRERFPKGRVSDRDYPRIRSDIRELFEGYEIGGRKIIRKAYFKEEIYSPPQLDAAADIILLSRPGYDLKAGLEKKEEYGLNHFTGMHLQDNAFFYTTRPDFLPARMTIFDVKGIIEKSVLG